VGSSKTLSGTVQPSAGDVVISTAEWSGAGCALTGISIPTRIAEGQKISFKVTFTPSTSGAANDGLAISNNYRRTIAPCEAMVLD